MQIGQPGYFDKVARVEGKSDCSLEGPEPPLPRPCRALAESLRGDFLDSGFPDFPKQSADCHAATYSKYSIFHIYIELSKVFKYSFHRDVQCTM
jgi:hypothetical protein